MDAGTSQLTHMDTLASEHISQLLTSRLASNQQVILVSCGEVSKHISSHQYDIDKAVQSSWFLKFTDDTKEQREEMQGTINKLMM